MATTVLAVACSIQIRAPQPPRAALAGEVLALHHRLPFDADARELRGPFALLAAPTPDVATADSHATALWVGEWPLCYAREGANCVLAPTIDGGQTRRLIAIAPVAEGEAWCVPAPAREPDLAHAIERALALAGNTSVVAHRDEVRFAGSTLKGRGVFAHRAYRRGEHIVTWPSDVAPARDVPTSLRDYVYSGAQPGTRLVVHGHGMLYNHDDEPNIRSQQPVTPEGEIIAPHGGISFYAVRDIARGEELVQSYGDEWWARRRQSSAAAVAGR